MKLEDYIPYYTDIENDDFNSNTYAKKEFRETLDYALPQQVFIPRFMSTHTMYRSLLVFHEMGTGKTCTAINTIEQIFSENSTIKNALILLKGQSLIDNFINELVTVCKKEKYQSLYGNARIKTKLRPRYEFATYEVFAKRLATMNASLYNNYVIVIDEVHNIVTSSLTEYTPIFNFLHEVSNSKILLLTGTPMRDKVNEIAYIMNLILPTGNQVPVSTEFDSMFIRGLDIINTDKLSTYLTGRISYIKSSISDTPKIFIGKKLGSLTSFIVFPTYMSSTQTSAYSNAYSNDKDLYNSSRQASLLVFPNGLFGSSGFTEYITRIVKKNKIGESKNRYTWKSDALAKQFYPMNQLELYSSKYAFVIKQILENPSKLFFIYGEFVEGSGLILFSKILELYGFSRSIGKQEHGKHYSLVTNMTTSVKQTRKVLSVFNSSDNKFGAYIQVIIGSRMISEGFTLKNVSYIHILTPYWNYGEIDQAIARGYRAFSHDSLIAAGIKPEVQVYQHVAIPLNGESIDLYMYETSERKDIQIKHMEHIIKLNAIDCELFKSINSRFNKNFSRECDYLKCEYTCNNINQLPVDDTTYNLYYSDNEVSKLAENIKSALQNGNLYKTFNYLSPLILSNAVDKIKFIERRSVIGYPKIDGQFVYASPSKYDNSDLTNMYYIANPSVSLRIPIESIAQKYLYVIKIPKLIDDVCQLRSEEALHSLPLNIQEEFIKSSFIVGETPTSSFIRQVYSNYIHTVGDTYVVTLNKDNIQCFSNNEWNVCPENIVSENITTLQDIEQRATEFGYYGIQLKNKFYIKFILQDEAEDKRLKSRGRVCTTIDKSDLLGIASKANISIDKKLSKPKICSVLYDWFKENNLILYS